MICLLGDFDQAEEALHEGFSAAMEQWPVEGVPNNPVAWLVSVGRFKAIDAIRRQARITAWDAERLEAVLMSPRPWTKKSCLNMIACGWCLLVAIPVWPPMHRWR